MRIRSFSRFAHAVPATALALLPAACSEVGGDSVETFRESFSPAAYDSARSVTVSFGSKSAARDDVTSEWDGTTMRRPSVMDAPTAREGHVLGFDEANGVTVLFGGFEGFGVLRNDTWTWDGTTWTQVLPGSKTMGPGLRYSAAAAYDSARDVLVMFGGRNLLRLNDLWEWNGTTWTQRFGFPTPDPRSRHAMAFDSNRNVTVMFGGFTNARNAETWEWNGTSWTKRNLDPGERPTGRYLHAMAFDSVRNVTVLFGGYTGQIDGGTWEYNGSRWTQIEVEGDAPTPRVGHGMAFDEARGVVVLFGGYDGGYPGDTWEWDGTLWTRRESSPPPYAGPPVQVRGQILFLDD